METYVPHDFRPKDLEDLPADEMDARESKKKRREDLKAQREAAAARKKWEEENPDIVAEENVKAIESTGCRVGDEVIFGHFRRILSATPQVCEDTRCLLKVF